MNTNLINGAGILIYFDNTPGFDKTNDKELLYLCLIDKKEGQYDFPKGCVDLNEEAIDCAIRETKEETCLIAGKDYVFDNNDYLISADKLAMYLAKYIDVSSSIENFCLNSSKKIKIEKNPDSKIKEHDGFIWLSYKEAKKNLLPYLHETLDYYNSKIKNIKNEKQ